MSDDHLKPDDATGSSTSAQKPPAKDQDLRAEDTETGTADSNAGAQGLDQAATAMVLNRRQWLELFFDLVIVAAVAVMAHALGEHDDLGGFGLFVVLYGAIWFAWVALVMYADIAREQTRVRTVAFAMFGVAVMAASNPMDYPNRANAFAIAFVVVRLLLGRGSLSTGRLLRTWSGLQSSGAIVLWLGSTLVATPAKFYVWAVAIAIDLILTLVRPGYDEHDLAALVERQRQRDEQRRQRKEGDQHHDAQPPNRRLRWLIVATRHEDGEHAPKRERRPDPSAMEVADLDNEHLIERLGLLYIIVLGEGISQLVLTSADLEWTGAGVAVAIAGALILTLLWRETFGVGLFGAEEHAGGPAPSVRYTLVVPLFNSLGVVVAAAGLGIALEGADHGLKASTQALMCGGLFVHLLTSMGLGMLARRPRRWVLRLALPSILLAVLTSVALITGEATTGPVAMSWVLVVCMLCTGTLQGDPRDPRNTPRSETAPGDSARA